MVGIVFFSGIEPISLYFFFAIFIASVVRGLSGMGASATILLLLSLVYPPALIIQVNFALEITASLFLLLISFKGIDSKFILKITPGFLLFTPVGLALIHEIDFELARIIFSTSTIIFALILIRNKSVFKNDKKIVVNVILILGSFMAGFMNGFASMGGIAIIFILLLTSTNSEKIRSTLIVWILFVTIYGLGIELYYDRISDQFYSLYFSALPFLFLGNYVGYVLFKKLNLKAYRKFVLIFLLLLAAMNLSSILFF